jgi:delta8-fatty-acid desaturase
VCHLSIQILLSKSRLYLQQLPRHNLLAASHIVKRFAAEQGLEYAEFGFAAGNHEVIGVLADVASQVGVVGMVAKSEVEKAVKG